MTTTIPNATNPLIGELASTLALGRAVEERMRKECACALAVPQVWVDLNARALAIDAEMAKERGA